MDKRSPQRMILFLGLRSYNHSWIAAEMQTSV